MKLKRFLVRYNPPGIGLEVEDENGEIEVRHKDLLPAGEVSSPPQIAKLVEELCSSEPKLVNVRKHGNTLTVLLSRLYQVETLELPSNKDGSRSQRSAEDGGQADGQQENEPDSGQLSEGARVVLVGLSGKLSTHNGMMATLIKAKPSKDKYEVVISSGRPEQYETLKVKGSEHLLPVLTVTPPLEIGTSVVLVRLRNHTELNGCIGRVVDCQEKGQRYEIRTAETGQLFRVKFDNVVPVEASAATELAKENLEPNSAAMASGDSPEGSRPAKAMSVSPSGASLACGELLDPGAVIEIHGLKSNMSYNGEQAKILVVDSETLRYEVRMSDGSVKKLRAENARLVGQGHRKEGLAQLQAHPPSTPHQEAMPDALTGYSRGGSATSGVPLRLGPSPTGGKRKASDLSLPRADWSSPSTEKLHHEASPQWGDHVDLRPGATVQLTGLRSAPYLNGQRAVVIQDLVDRAEIRLEDGSVKKVRKENIELVAAR